MTTIFILVAVATLIYAGLSLVVILFLAKRGIYFTRIEKGNTVFINRGDDMRVIWPNVGGYRMSSDSDLDGRHWLIKDDDEEKRNKAFFYGAMCGTVWFQKWLWETFGIRFISWFWPNTRVHTFGIDRKRYRDKSSSTKETPLSDRVIVSPECPEVSSLRVIVPRPIYMSELELPGDNSKINLVILPTFWQVIPSIPVYYYKGDFFPFIDAAIEATMIDFVATHRVAVTEEGEFHSDDWNALGDEDKKKYFPAPLNFFHWMKIGKGEGSVIEKRFRNLNASRSFYNKVRRKKGNDGKKSEIFKELERITHGKPPEISGNIKGEIPHGIIPRFGFSLVSIKLADWEAHEDTQKLGEAILTKQTELHKAEGTRQEAMGTRDAIKLKASAESDRINMIMQKLIDQGVPADEANRTVQVILEMENLKEWSGKTYVRGGGGVMVQDTN